jgi:hypothetical protein
MSMSAWATCEATLISHAVGIDMMSAWIWSTSKVSSALLREIVMPPLVAPRSV